MDFSDSSHMTLAEEPPIRRDDEADDESVLCEEPVRKRCKKLYAIPVAGTTAFLASVAGCVLFSGSNVGESRRCFGPTWLGLFAALVGQLSFCAACILIALFVKTFRSASWLNFFAGLVVLVFYEAVGLAVFSAGLRGLRSLAVLRRDESSDAADPTEEGRAVFSWLILCFWCSFVLWGFYRCVFGGRKTK